VQSEPIVRLFDVLRKEGVDYVTQADLKQLLNGILLSHPGLEFLQETPEFQER
jgi:serine/threonine-protein phosphatase 2A regulatory subunit B''